ncbi:MAG: DNA-3-methyladenine glycosylase I [Pseudomonas sp.]
MMATENSPGAGVIVCEDGFARPLWASADPLLRGYYDTEWGMPVRTESAMYERIVLEGFQAGLSWLTILRKREAFRAAFHHFDPERVASFTASDIKRLMLDSGIIRNQRKVVSAINNANATLRLRDEGGLVALVWSFQPDTTPMPRTHDDIPTSSAESLALSKVLRKKGFSFVGPVTMYALMEATGIVDTHLLDSYRRGSSGVWLR